MTYTNTPIESNRILDFIRPLSAQGTNPAVLVPRITGSDYDLSRDTNDTDTKDGKLTTVTAVTTEPKITVTDTDSIELMYLTDSIMQKLPIEHWHVYLDKKNDDGKYFAYYTRCLVTEDSHKGDPGDYAEREFTLTPQDGVAYGYTPLPGGITEEELNELLFIGMDPVTGENPNGNGVAATISKMPAKD